MQKQISDWKVRLCKRVIENDNYIEADRKKSKIVGIQSLNVLKQINMQYLFSNTLGNAKVRGKDKACYNREEISLFMFHMIARMDRRVNLLAIKLFKIIGNNDFQVEQQKQDIMYTFQLEHVTHQHVTHQKKKLPKPKDLGKFFVDRMSISA